MSSATPTSWSTSRCSTRTGIRASVSIASRASRTTRTSARSPSTRGRSPRSVSTRRARPVHAACWRSRCRRRRSSTRSNRSRATRNSSARHFGRSVRQPWPGHDLGLTLRESEVALFLAQGLRNREHRDRALGQREHREDAPQVDLPEDGRVVARGGDRPHLARRELQPEAARLPRTAAIRRSDRSRARIPRA